MMMLEFSPHSTTIRDSWVESVKSASLLERPIIDLKILLLCFGYIFILSCNSKTNNSLFSLNNAFENWYKKNHTININYYNKGFHFYNDIYYIDLYREYINDLKRFQLELSQLDVNNIASSLVDEYYFLKNLINNLLIVNSDLSIKNDPFLLLYDNYYSIYNIIENNNLMMNEKIDLLFNSINKNIQNNQHVLNNKDADSCFKCIKNHLAKNGKFILDILVPNPLFLYRPKNHELPVMDFKDSLTGELVEIYESNSYDRETEICDIHWTYKYKDKTQDRMFNYQMKMYYPDTINRLLIDNNFIIDSVYGDYDMNDFNEESHLQIYISR